VSGGTVRVIFEICEAAPPKKSVSAELPAACAKNLQGDVPQIFLESRNIRAAAENNAEKRANVA
jgi:hypothetical protein